jgi:hypothetical protein
MVRRSGGAESVTQGSGMHVLHRNDNRQALDILGTGRHHCKSLAVVARVRSRPGEAGVARARPGAGP